MMTDRSGRRGKHDNHRRHGLSTVSSPAPPLQHRESKSIPNVHCAWELPPWLELLVTTVSSRRPLPYLPARQLSRQILPILRGSAARRKVPLGMYTQDVPGMDSCLTNHLGWAIVVA